MVKVAGLPWTTREGPATNVIACGRPFAALAKRATARAAAKARGMRRFVLAVIGTWGGVPRRQFLLRSKRGFRAPSIEGFLGRALQSGPCRQISAHAMDPGSRRRRGRAEV